jgi:phosphatidylinositol alpha-1,6-mannosyltransferase
MVRISPGVDAASYLVPEHEVRRQRRQWGWPDETVVIVTVARMERRKNHAMLLESVAALRSRGLPVAYVCGGDGEERSRLEELCRARNLQPWVRFTGAVTDEEKRLTFAAGQIHAMPSIQVGPMIEGFGIVFIEAAAAGLPSLAGNTGGQAEAVLHGETGFVVDGTSLTDVCDALERLVSDPGLRTRMGARGRQWAAENDWARITQKAHSAISGLDQTS